MKWVKRIKVEKESEVGTFIEDLESLRQAFQCRSLIRTSNDPGNDSLGLARVLR